MASITEPLEKLAKATQETAQGGIILTTQHDDDEASLQFFHSMVTSHGAAMIAHEEADECVDSRSFPTSTSLTHADDYFSALHRQSHQHTSKEDTHIHTDPLKLGRRQEVDI